MRKIRSLAHPLLHRHAAFASITAITHTPSIHPTDSPYIERPQLNCHHRNECSSTQPPSLLHAGQEGNRQAGLHSCGNQTELVSYFVYILGWPEPYIYTYIRCTYGIFSREITVHTVIYGAYIRFWPTLFISEYAQTHRDICAHRNAHT